MQVGFIGIGNMGAPMVANIAKAGHELLLYDLDELAAERAAAASGARAAKELAEIARTEVIVTMLPTGPIVRSVLLKAEGGAIANGAKPGTIVIDMSSSEPMGTKALGAELAERGIVLIDAPVSGGVARAATGKLAIMIGGDDAEAIARVKPLLSAMGDRQFETGGLGSGHAMKALNNFVAATSYAATAEALLIGRRFGLDPTTMVDILNVSTGRNFHTDAVMKEHVIGEKFAAGFSVGLLAKDVGIARELATAMRYDAPVLRLVAERWALARDTLGADRDNTAAILSWDRDMEQSEDVA
jgi:3-hydroxyisobutyrate dehydrogenase